jgi:hypothetical protein
MTRAWRRLVAVLPAMILAGACVMLALGSQTRADDKKDLSPKPAPQGAVVLFDGKDLSAWVARKGGAPAAWKVKNGYVEVTPKTGDILTKEKFGDFQLHVEFWLPLMADAKGQARANSGVYLQGRYEIQVLDSYNNDTYPDGACGALYKIIAPSKNASKPPEQWQTYDITFRAPHVDAQDKVTEKGVVTVVHNGVTVIDNGLFDHPTGGEIDNKLGTPGPILLQDHGNRVRFRNIWLKPLPAK